MVQRVVVQRVDTVRGICTDRRVVVDCTAPISGLQVTVNLKGIFYNGEINHDDIN